MFTFIILPRRTIYFFFYWCNSTTCVALWFALEILIYFRVATFSTSNLELSSVYGDFVPFIVMHQANIALGWQLCSSVMQNIITSKNLYFGNEHEGAPDFLSLALPKHFFKISLKYLSCFGENSTKKEFH